MEEWVENVEKRTLQNWLSSSRCQFKTPFFLQGKKGLTDGIYGSIFHGFGTFEGC